MGSNASSMTLPITSLVEEAPLLPSFFNVFPFILTSFQSITLIAFLGCPLRVGTSFFGTSHPIPSPSPRALLESLLTWQLERAFSPVIPGPCLDRHHCPPSHLQAFGEACLILSPYPGSDLFSLLWSSCQQLGDACPDTIDPFSPPSHTGYCPS